MPFYPSIPAGDGTSLTAPANALFEVYELTDTAFTTPLPLTTSAGVNAAPLVTTAQGVVPPVNVTSPNLSHIFKSGTWEWRRDSFDGAAKAVEVSRAAAERAALAAEAPTDKMVEDGIARADLPGKLAEFVANGPVMAGAVAGYLTDPANVLSKAVTAVARAEVTLRPNASVIAQGAKGDWTGRPNVAGGTGTDDRAAIQRALNAASSISGTEYYSYLNRRSYPVVLPPGDYYISAPADGSASLVVPPGVTFDTSNATMHFDYPSNPTTAWAGIQVSRYANLLVGKLRVRGAAPNADAVYDAVRLVYSDNSGTRVWGGKDSEIKGFQGAAIRGIGAFIVHIGFIRLEACVYGYVASNWGDGFGSLQQPEGAGTRRVHTDIHFENVQFNNITEAGFLGTVSGAAGNINATTQADSGLAPHFSDCSFENSPNGYAIWLVNAFTFNMRSCHIEELGKADAMIRLENVRTVHIDTLQVNLGGREVRGKVANPRRIFFIGAVQHMQIDVAYVHNTQVASLLLMEPTPTNWSTNGIYWDANALEFGPGVSNMASHHVRATSARPLVLGNVRLWADENGRLRTKQSNPSGGHLDGNILSAVDTSNTSAATYAATKDEHTIIARVPGTVSLPANANGVRLTVKNAAPSGSTVVIDAPNLGGGKDYIEDAQEHKLTVAGSSVTLVSAGSKWFIVSKYTP